MNDLSAVIFISDPETKESWEKETLIRRNRKDENFIIDISIVHNK